MLLTAPRGASFTLTLPDEEATLRFATDLGDAGREMFDILVGRAR